MPAQVIGVDEGGMDAVECVNEQCSEYRVVKPLLATLMDGEQVWCGVCQQACEVDWYQGLTYTIPAPAWEEGDAVLDAKITALDAKMDTMMAMLARSLGTTEGEANG